ncbi:hypothetical protein CLV78_108123 [Aliiruegeria haliotis]|uniref:ACT domain-containing protein n=1 Tax=Aliiruegeria haliotis TaxID=1280846 RepID=A0A2T0RL45_9RHOB|nr:hypothetical protein [Aliiruegeria haliotis]PRY21851.1 hypothetical protein CLV78_108123 [Aliiruegeria haliotis]
MHEHSGRRAPLDVDVTVAGVPVSDIQFSRRTFGAWRLSFEVLLESRRTSQGMDLCADLDRAGLAVRKVSFGNNGCLHLILSDDGSADPHAISDIFDEHSAVSILQWTNIVKRTGR